MRYLFLVFVFSLSVQAKENSALTFRFVEATSVNEKGGLPPKIEMVLEVACNEELAEVIRHEKTDPKTQKVTIAVGAIVRKDSLIRCSGKKNKLVVDAGTSFSGRDYEIVKIKK